MGGSYLKNSESVTFIGHLRDHERLAALQVFEDIGLARLADC